MSGEKLTAAQLEMLRIIAGIYRRPDGTSPRNWRSLCDKLRDKGLIEYSGPHGHRHRLTDAGHEALKATKP